MKVVCIADTHGFHKGVQIPPGDLLIHAGDLTLLGEEEVIRAFNSFLGDLPHPYKVVVAGNHDKAFQSHPAKAQSLLTCCTYLQDSAIEIGGLLIYGSPWQPRTYYSAFGLKRGAELQAKWDQIPVKVDILVTHGPPAQHGDRTGHGGVGDAELLAAVLRVRPSYHVFGHIHSGYGVTKGGDTTFINASVLNNDYQVANPPIVFDI